jgi:hypothetical protein
LLLSFLLFRGHLLISDFFQCGSIFVVGADPGALVVLVALALSQELEAVEWFDVLSVGVDEKEVFVTIFVGKFPSEEKVVEPLIFVGGKLFDRLLRQTLG